MTTHAWAKIRCLKNGAKLGCCQNFTGIFGSNGGNRVSFCKDLANFVYYVFSKNEYLAIFHFESNQIVCYFQILNFWLGWIGTALLAMQNLLLGSDFHLSLYPPEVQWIKILKWIIIIMIITTKMAYLPYYRVSNVSFRSVW